MTQIALPVFSVLVAVAGVGQATDSLDGVDTTPLESGHLAWVRTGPAANTLFRLDKSDTTTAPDGVNVVQPLTGPGRWHLLAGGGGGSTASIQIVDTISATPPPGGTRLVDIVTTSLADGSMAYVRSVEDLFVLEKAVALTADGITIVDPTVGTGQWTRRNAGSQRWLTQASWFINATLGDDENAGSATGAGALRTHAELERRWGPDPLLRQSVTVTIETDLDATVDATPEINVTLRGLAILEYIGTPTTVASGTLDSAISTNPGTNTQQSVTDAAIGDWAPHVGLRIRLTANNAISWIAKAVTPTQARTGQFLTYVSQPFQTLNGYTPVGNEAYVLETLPNVRALRVSIKRARAEGGIAGNFNPFVMRNIKCDTSAVADSGAIEFDTVGAFRPVVFACDLTLSWLICDVAPTMVLAATKLAPAFGIYTIVSKAGSLDLEGIVSLNGHVTIFYGSSLVSSQSTHRNLWQGPGNGTVQVRSGAVWVATGVGGADGFFDFQNGLSLQSGARYEGLITYGAGNTAFGMVVARGSVLNYLVAGQEPTVTGASGDISISGTPYASPEDLPALFMWGGVHADFAVQPAERIQRGIATLVNGTVAVGGAGARIFLTATSRIMVSRNTFAGTVAGQLEVPDATKVNGNPGTAAFTINSRTAAGAIADDDSTVNWEIIA